MATTTRDIHALQPARSGALALGFAAAVAMWVVAYVSMMKPGLIVGEALFVLTLGSLFVAGLIGGRFARLSEHGAISGAKIGLLTATLNLLIVGSMLVDPETRSLKPDAIMWIVGNFVVSIILASAGGALGGMRRNAQPPKSEPNWLNWFTIVAAVTVGLLLVTGGLVTGLKAGLAVPDWPNSFGHNMLLYPMSEMVGGVYYEHAHRLYGMLVGVTAITLVVASFVFDRRGWLRGLTIVYLLAVIVQGYMGGMRVTEISTLLAIVHGVFAQLVFVGIVCIAAFTSTTWRVYAADPHAKEALRADRRWSHVLSIALILQLIMGAMYRHMHRAMENPPQPLHPLFTHIGLAVFITLLAIYVGGRAWGTHRDKPVLPALGRTLLLLLGLQLVLGVSAMIVVWMSKPHDPPPVHEVAITTAHQATGALLLATASLLTVWTRRLSRG